MLRYLLSSILFLTIASSARAQSNPSFEGSLRYITIRDADTTLTTMYYIKGSRVIQKQQFPKDMGLTEILIDTVSGDAYYYESILGHAQGMKIKLSDLLHFKNFDTMYATSETKDIDNHPCQKYYVVNSQNDTTTIWAAAWYTKDIVNAIRRLHPKQSGESPIAGILDKGYLPVETISKHSITKLVEIQNRQLLDEIFVLPNTVVYENPLDSLKALAASMTEAQNKRLAALPALMHEDSLLESNLPPLTKDFNGTLTYRSRPQSGADGQTQIVRFKNNRCLIQEDFSDSKVSIKNRRASDGSRDHIWEAGYFALPGKDSAAKNEKELRKRPADDWSGSRGVVHSDSIFFMRMPYQLKATDDDSVIAKLRTRKFLILDPDKSDTVLTVWAAEWRPANVARSLRKLRNGFTIEPYASPILFHGLIPVRIVSKSQTVELIKIDRTPPSDKSMKMPDIEYKQSDFID